MAASSRFFHPAGAPVVIQSGQMMRALLKWSVRLTRGLGVCSLAIGSTACGGGGGGTSLTGPTPTATVETFSGRVDPGGTSFHAFKVGVAGTVNVTLTEAGPPATIFMGLAVGVPNDTGCVPVVGAAVQTQAGSQAQIFGGAGVGDYCVAVFDVGNQASAVTYTVTVSHF